MDKGWLVLIGKPFTVIILFLAFAIPLSLFTHAGAQVKADPAVSPENSPAHIVDCRGRVQPSRRFEPRLLPGERVLEITASPGQRVDRGTVLARLADDGLEGLLVTLQEKRIDLIRKRFEAKAIDLELDYKRTTREKLADRQKEIDEKHRRLGAESLEKELRDLEDRGLELDFHISLLENRQQQYKTLSDDRERLLQTIERQIQETSKRLDDLVVRAPFSGRIVRTDFPAGPVTSRPAPGAVILELWDDSKLTVRAKVLQHQLPFIRPGDEALVVPESGNGRPYTVATTCKGKVRSIQPPEDTAQEGSFPTFPVLIDLEAPPDSIRPGMDVPVRIHGTAP